MSVCSSVLVESRSDDAQSAFAAEFAPTRVPTLTTAAFGDSSGFSFRAS
jgi:hypothetical protein